LFQKGTTRSFVHKDSVGKGKVNPENRGRYHQCTRRDTLGQSTPTERKPHRNLPVTALIAFL